MADPMQDATMQQGADQDMDMSGGYCIEIRVMPGDKVSVGVEPIADEMKEEGATPGGEEDYQPAPSFMAALKIANDIYKHAGQINDAASGGNEDMSAGYGS